MGPSQICGCPFREPRVFEIAHIYIYIYVCVCMYICIHTTPICEILSAFFSHLNCWSCVWVGTLIFVTIRWTWGMYPPVSQRYGTCHHLKLMFLGNPWISWDFHIYNASPIRWPWLVTHGPILFQDLLTTFPELHLFSLEGPLDSLDLLAKADDSAENISQSDDICSYIFIDCLYDLNDLNPHI